MPDLQQRLWGLHPSYIRAASRRSHGVHEGRYHLRRIVRREFRYRLPLSRNRASLWNGCLLDGLRVDGYPRL